MAGRGTTGVEGATSLKRLCAMAEAVHYVRHWMLLKGLMKENNMIELYNFLVLIYDALN